MLDRKRRTREDLARAATQRSQKRAEAFVSQFEPDPMDGLRYYYDDAKGRRHEAEIRDGKLVRCPYRGPIDEIFAPGWHPARPARGEAVPLISEEMRQAAAALDGTDLAALNMTKIAGEVRKRGIGLSVGKTRRTLTVAEAIELRDWLTLAIADLRGE